MSTPSGGQRRIDRVLAPEFLSDLASLTLEEVRARRQDADQEEVDLSYLRRMLQGRSEIAAAELSRRGTAAEGAAGSEAEVVSRLAAAMTDDSHDRSPAQGLGRYRSVEPSQVGDTRRQGESLLATSGMSDPGALDEGQLSHLLARLADEEHEVSAARKSVQSVLDALSAEVTRRYRDGSATVDTLLEG